MEELLELEEMKILEDEYELIVLLLSWLEHPELEEQQDCRNSEETLQEELEE